VQDKRSHPRVSVAIRVTCEPKNGSPFVGVAKDISIGGMFVEAAEQPPFGTEVTIVARLPGMKNEARLPGVIRWSKPGGLGVQFGLLGARETHAISELMKG
jgi:Tfp pilus assembly protein PilZ